MTKRGHTVKRENRRLINTITNSGHIRFPHSMFKHEQEKGMPLDKLCIY